MAPPANWTPITVEGTYITPDGLPASGTVTFTNSLYLRDPDLNFVIVPKVVQVTLNGSGHFSTTLMATDDPDIDPTFYYTVTEVISGNTTTFPLLVPYDAVDGIIDLADVDRNATIPPEPEVYVRTMNGMWGDILVPDDFGIIPANSVVTETSFGQASAVGVSIEYAREDHTHGTPAAPSASGTVAAETSYGVASSAGAASAFSRGDHTHGTPSLTSSTPAAETIGASGVVGVATTPARADHVHAMPAFGSVVTETSYGQASSNGAATTVSRSDHTHGTQAVPTASAVGAIPNSNGITYYGSGLLSARPAAGTAGRIYYATDLNTEFYDNGTTWVQHDQVAAISNSWTAIGHSYLQFNASSYNQRSRLDSILRGRWDAEPTNWVNLAIAGSRATVEGAAQGGWATMIREINKLPAKTAPYTSADGGLLICTGINDLGTLGGATAQMQTCFGHAIRFMISRWRASTIFETTAANTAFGGTWTTETNQQDRASGGEWRYHATTGGTVTITLPADYNGEPVVICLIGRFGNLGGTVTWSGTAGVTGTTVTDNVMPSGTLSNIPVLKRVTNLTSANAGQTIIGTVTANSGLVYYDCWWLEAKEAPPVIVCNVARPTASAISTLYPGWTAQTGSHDNDVAAFNTVITNVKAEFDGMVQIADIDSVLAKTASNFTDGLHPNERGAARMADEIDNARRRMTLTGVASAALNMNMAPRYAGGLRRRRLSGYYWTSDYTAVGTAYTLVAGDEFAIPFEVTEMDEVYNRFALEKTAVGTGSPTIRWGIYSDYMHKGYPDIQLQEFTSGGTLTLTAATGAQLNPAAQFTWYADIGLYWLVMKIETIGSGTWSLATLGGPSPYLPQASTAGVFVASPRAVGYKLTGQATGSFLSTKTTWPTGAVPVASAPYIGCLKV